MAKNEKDESLLELMDKKILTMNDYIEILKKDARPVRTSAQRIYDMIIEAGVEKSTKFGNSIKLYKFFEARDEEGKLTKDSVFGLEESLMDLVKHFHAAARRWGAEKRVVLLHGPVATAKSTIVNLLKRGVEKYSETNPLYSFRWKDLGDFGSKDSLKVGDVSLFNHTCDMHEEPLKLLHPSLRKELLKEINANNFQNKDALMDYQVKIEQDLCPHCRFNYKLLMEHYNGNWEKVMQHIEISRIFISEIDRVGIGTFQPKDEKNQDSTDLTGNTDFYKIGLVGSDSDPRGFNFDGELNKANRGIAEFIEMLKLDVAFLFDLLGAQEEKIKPKKFPQIPVDLVILGHTNQEEYQRLSDNKYMKALKSRTIKVDVPYNLDFNNEIKIYERDYNKETVPNHHIAPHTLEIAAKWANLTRMQDHADVGDTLKKIHLYAGEIDSEFTVDKIAGIYKEGKDQGEGMSGIPPRFIQDAIMGALAGHDEACINPFVLLNELKGNLRKSALIENEEQIKELEGSLEKIKTEYEDIVKNEVRKAIIADEESLELLCNNYMENVNAYLNGGKILDQQTKRHVEPNEQLMRGIEEKVNISEHAKDDFRSELMNFVGSVALSNENFSYKKNATLKLALELKLFEDQKDKLPLHEYHQGVMGKKAQDKINTVKETLINDFGYCKICAEDVLKFTASIFARGDAKIDE